MTDNNSGVLVIVEVEDSQPIDLALEMLALARRLTDNIGGTVTAVAFGTGLENIGEMLVAFGADQVLINDNKMFARNFLKLYFISQIFIDLNRSISCIKC